MTAYVQNEEEPRESKVDRYIGYGFNGLIIIIVLTSLLIALHPFEDTWFFRDSYDFMNEGWSYVDEAGNSEDITLPTKVDVEGDTTAVLTRTLPETIDPDQYLCVATHLETMRVYVDDELVYDYATDPSLYPYNIPVPSLWNIFPLSEDYAGQEIRMEFESQDEYLGEFTPIVVGSQAGVAHYLVSKYYFAAVVAVICLLYGLLLIALYLLSRAYKNAKKETYYLGIFAIFAGLWMLAESSVNQLFFDNKTLLAYVDYLSLMMFPLSFVLYVNTIKGLHRKWELWILMGLFALDILANIVLQFAGITDMHKLIRLFHVLLGAGMVLVLCKVIVEAFHFKNPDARRIILALAVLVVFAGLEMGSYYFGTEVETGNFTKIGVLLFVLISSRSDLIRLFKTMSMSHDALKYEQLAVTDFLTNCKNRTGFARDLDTLDDEDAYVMIMGDVNNLKYVNDTFGHDAGDRIIVECAQAMDEILGPHGICYRIGGDEFACIITKEMDKVEVEKLIVTVNERLDDVARTLPYPFSAAFGFFVKPAGIKRDVSETIRVADQAMYREKMEMKNNKHD